MKLRCVEKIIVLIVGDSEQDVFDIVWRLAEQWDVRRDSACAPSTPQTHPSPTELRWIFGGCSTSSDFFYLVISYFVGFFDTNSTSSDFLYQLRWIFLRTHTTSFDIFYFIGKKPAIHPYIFL